MRMRGRLLGVLGVLVLVGAACTSNNTSTTGGGATPQMIHSIGPGEGELNLVNWDGYLEPQWVKPFEDQTGCKVTPSIGTSSDDMYNKMTQQKGVYDGVSASGDATNRLIAAGAVAPIDPNLFPQFHNMIPALQSPPHNTVNGIHYGVPWVWGINLLMYNTQEVTPVPTSWNVVFDPNSRYAGKITAYDSPIYIADAALYAGAHNPDLGITDPYELDQKQFDAAISLLQGMRPNIRNFWAYVGSETKPFKSGDLVVGTAWPTNLRRLLEAGAPVAGQLNPSEGVTGWADTWMMSSAAPHPNCMLMWMQYTMQPAVQAQVADWYGATPSNTQSCLIMQENYGYSSDILNNVYHCGDQAYLKSIYLWKTPLPDCGDSRGNVCVDYSTWTAKWQDITGG